MGYWQADSSARDNYIKKKEGVSFKLPSMAGLKSAGISAVGSLERAGSAAYAGIGAQAEAIDREETPLSLRVKADLAKLDAQDTANPVLSKIAKVGGELVKEGLDKTGIAGAIGEKYGKAEQALIEKSDKTLENPVYKPELNTIRDEKGNIELSKLKNADVFLNNFGQLFGTTIPAIGAGLVAGPIGAIAVSGLVEKGSAQQEFEKNMAEQRGVSVEELSKEDKDRVNAASTAYGMFAAIPEALVPGKFISSIMGNKAGSTLLKRILVNAPLETVEAVITEGSTEGLQRFGQNVIQRLAEINKDKPLSEGVIDEAIAGAISGGGFGLIGGLAPSNQQPVNASGTNGPDKEPPVQTPSANPTSTTPDPITIKEAQSTLSEINRSAPQIKSLIENAIDTPVTPEAVSSLSDQEKQVLTLGLQTVKNATPDPAIKASIDQSLTALGVKVEPIKQAPVTKVETPEVTKVTEPTDKLVEQVKPSFSQTYAFEQMNKKGFDVGVASDFEAFDQNDKILSLPKKQLSDAWKERTGLELETNDDGDIILYRGGENDKMGTFQYLTKDKKSASQYGEVRKYAVDPRDISWSGEEQAFLFEPRKSNKKLSSVKEEQEKKALPKPKKEAPKKPAKKKAYEKNNKPVKKSDKKPDTSKKEATKKAPKKSDKKTEGSPKVVKQIRPIESESDYRIMTGLDLAQAGERFYSEASTEESTNEPHFTSSGSTFPDWIPDHLRRRSIIDPVLKHIANGTLPKGSNQVELYNELAAQLNQSDTPMASFDLSKKNLDKFLSTEVAKSFIREVQAETNPNIQAVLQFRLFKKWIEEDENGQRFITRGVFTHEDMTAAVALNLTKKQFKKALRHEIRHAAFHLMPASDQFKVLAWYKSLSERELVSIYGSEVQLNNYRDTYGDDETKMADETANWNNDNRDVKAMPTNAFYKAIALVKKVLGFINSKITTKGKRRKEVEALYDEVFTQQGGEKFARSPGRIKELIDQGIVPGRILIDDNIKKSGMASKSLVTDTGAIRAQEVFNSEWKKLYGVDAPKNLMNLLSEGFNVGNTVKSAFEQGKTVQREKSKDEREFQTAAEVYVQEYVPKALQGEFIESILKARSSVNLDYVINKVEKVLEKEKKSTKELEKRLAQEFKLREKLKKMNVDFKRSKIEQREKNAKRLKEVRQELIIMFREKTASAQDVRRKVIEYVKLNIPKDKQGEFLTAVRNSKTRRELERVRERIDKKRSQYERANLVKSITKVVENVDKLPVDLQRTIVKITSEIELKKHTKRLLNRLKKTQEFLDRQASDVDMPRRVLNELGILKRTPFEELSTEQLININNRFQQYNLVGRNIMRDKLVRSEKEKNDLLAELKSGSINLDNIAPEERLNTFTKNDLANPDDLRSFKDKTKEFFTMDKDKFERLRLSLIGIDRLFNRLDSRADYTGPNYRIFKEPIDEKWNEWQHAEDQVLMAFYKMINELKLTEKNSERIAIYAYAQQRGGKKKLIEDRKFTERQIDAIQLNEKEMTAYQFMRRHLDDAHDMLTEKMERENNITLGKQENYFPMLTDYGVTKRLLEEMQDMSRMKNVAFGATKERKENASQVLKLNAFQVFDSYIGKAMYFTNMDSTLSRLNKLASSDTYREAVGENAQRAVLTWLDVLARKGGAVKKETKWGEWLNDKNGKLSVVVLGLRITTIAKQPLALLDGAGEIGAYAFAGTRKIIDQDWREFMRENSSEMRNRSGGDLEFERLTHNQVVPRIQDKAMYPIKFMDFYTAGAVWTGAYTKKMDELGLSVDFQKPNKEALKYANLVVRKTQSSGNFKDLPVAITSEYRTLSKMIFKFQTFVLNRWSYISEDLPDKMKNDKALAVQQISFLMLSMIGEAAISNTWYQMMNGAEDDEDKDSRLSIMVKSIISSTIGTVPFLGQLISSLNYGTTPVPIIEFGNKFFESLRSVFFAKKMETKEKHAIRTLSYSLGIYFGLPTEQARQLLESVLFPKGKGRDF